MDEWGLQKNLHEATAAKIIARRRRKGGGGGAARGLSVRYERSCHLHIHIQQRHDT